MSRNLIKGLGYAATIIGIGATLLTDWVSAAKMNEAIDERVNEALANRDNKNEEES